MSGAIEKSAAAQGSVEQALETLRREFCRGLDERIGRIEAARVLVNTDTQDAETALAVISAEAHRISGVAGSLGLTPIGNRARDIEAAIERLPDGALTPARRTALDAQVNDLLDLMEQNLLDD